MRKVYAELGSEDGSPLPIQLLSRHSVIQEAIESTKRHKLPVSWRCYRPGDFFCFLFVSPYLYDMRTFYDRTGLLRSCQYCLTTISTATKSVFVEGIAAQALVYYG